MSDAPIFVKKRTKSNTVRTREDATNEDDTEIKTPVSNFKNKSKPKLKQATPRISFNDDEKDSDGDVFQVKKSSLSRKLKQGGITASNVPGLAVSFEKTTLVSRTDGPIYDANYLSELRASTNRPPTASNGNGNELMFDASEMDGAVIENIEEISSISLSNAFEEMIIPSESSIKAAKEKRDRIRKIGETEEDFISLTVAKRTEGPTGPHPNSRLVREDDEMGEGDEDLADFTGAQERISLSKKGRKEDEKKRKLGMAEMIEDADEQDEETMEWEMAQVKRAVREDGKMGIQQTAPTATYKPTPIPAPTPIPTFEAAAARFAQTLTSATISHTGSVTALSSLTEEQVRLEEQEVELRRQVEQAEEKRAWFQTFRDRIEGVAQFLDEKYPGLEKLEEEHLSLLQERADMINRRRISDNEDDLVLLYGVPRDVLDSEDVAFDEYGRAVPSSTAPHSSVRYERRMARSSRHSSTEEEGYSTDSVLSHSDRQDFELAINNLKTKIATLFEDVKAKSFREPKYGIAIWFSEWREKWPDIYHNAFGGMGLVQTWELWARIELLGWIPLDTPPRLEEFQWYTQLYEYSRKDEEEELRPEDDLPVNMCSTMFIPRLNALILGGGFDPYSTKQMPHLIDIAEQIEAHVGATNDRYLLLLSTVAKTFRRAIAELSEQLNRYSSNISASRPGFEPASIPARRRLMNRAAKLIHNILRWRRYTKERDGLGLAITELLDGVLFKLANEGWEAGGEEVVKKVVKNIPPELIPMSIKSRLV